MNKDNFNDGGPAFPIVVSQDDVLSIGLTMRDYFAAKALNGLVVAILSEEGHGWKYADFASEAYQLADAMLAARAAQEEGK